MLIFPLKKEWYEKIRSGEKTIEYREVKPYWKRRISKEFCLEDEFHEIGNSLTAGNIKHPVKLRLSYTKECLEARINKVEIVDGKDTDLHIDKPVYAIHLEDVKEIGE